MKSLIFQELNDDIRSTYKSHMSRLNFTFSETTWFLLDSFDKSIRKNLIDKVIIYVILAKVGIENNQLLPEIKEEIKEITNNIDLSIIKNELSQEEFELFYNDFNEVKSKI